MSDPIAIQDIEVAPGTGVFAHRKGDVVPAENVKANGWEAFVAREGTKAAAKVHDEK